MRDFHKFEVWQKAHGLTLAIYKITAAFPREERYGLTSQLRRAASSVPANLAEGCGRNGDAELASFCAIAAGSASELEYHLLLAKDLNLVKSEDFEDLSGRAAELKRMLSGLLRTLKANS